MRHLIPIVAFLLFHSALIAQTYEGVSKPASFHITKAPTAPAYLVVENLQFKDADGNEIINADERTTLSFTIKNMGKGDAAGVQAIIQEKSNLKGLRFPNSESIGIIKSGSSQEVQINLEAAPDIDSGQANFNIEIQQFSIWLFELDLIHISDS